MILTQLVVKNFGPYLGRYSVDLAPASPERSVVLIRGHNGSGKTSLLEALLLALYGPFAHIGRRGSRGYERFLRELINNQADVSEGAFVELTLTVLGEEGDEVIRVRREWAFSSSRVKETVSVYRNGQFDVNLSERWNEFVEHHVPRAVAPLFFFDAEQIESLADPERARAALEAVFKSLLGLDVIDQTAKDLLVVERNARSRSSKEWDESRLESLEADFNRLRTEESDARLRVGSARNALERANRQLTILDKEVTAAGGDIFQSRRELEKRRDHLTARVIKLEDELREVAAGLLPLALVTDLLQDVTSQTRLEEEAQTALALLDVLSSRDHWVVEMARKFQVPKGAVQELESALSLDREVRGNVKVQSVVAGSAHSEVVRHILAESLPALMERTGALMQTQDQLLVELGEAGRALAAIPDADAIADLIETQTRRRREVATAEGVRKAESETLDRIVREKARVERELERESATLAQIEVVKEDAERTIVHSARVRATLKRLRAEVVERQIHEIQNLVLECLRRLLRKSYLINSLVIDPESFDLTFYDIDGAAITSKQLSAGERQLVAVALMWGLAKASRRQLPVVVDTPLGRLDRAHREALVEQYFPMVSHQTILLSTDTEIDEAAENELAGSISRTYTLAFEEGQKRSTRISELEPVEEVA